MEHGPRGVYFSAAGDRDWEPDPDVGGVNHLLFDHGASMAGVWRADPGAPGTAEPVTIPARETILVLAGSVRVTIDERAPRELRVGDMLSMPEGSSVGWDADPDCMVFWIYS